MARDAQTEYLVVSRGWLQKFLIRLNLVLCREATTGQSLPKDLVTKLVQFLQYSRAQMLKYELEFENLNMDETAIWVDLSSSTTLEKVGVTSVLMRTRGSENRLTVSLAAKEDRSKFKLMIVIPGENVPEGLQSWQVLGQWLEGR